MISSFSGVTNTAEKYTNPILDFCKQKLMAPPPSTGVLKNKLSVLWTLTQCNSNASQNSPLTSKDKFYTDHFENNLTVIVVKFCKF